MAKPKASTGLVHVVAREGYLHALEILQLIEVMQRQNLLQINAHLSEAGAGSAANVVRNSLIARIALLVVGCYSPTRNGDKHLRVAFEILRDHKLIRNEIAERGSADALSEAENLWHNLLRDPRLSSVKHFRDKYTAHIAEPDPNTPLPNYTEFFEFARETTKLMEKLAHGTGGTTETLDEQLDEMATSAQQFWRPWEAAPQ
jgi:hypothetical protein